MLMALLLGQLAPYASTAAIAPGRRAIAAFDLPLASGWAQLQSLPKRAIG